ncbi:MAG: Methylthioribose-1-phosphate isomerase [Candidatus Kapaibacterium sp.]|jgi:methylthioribose-1-phosphate isomerase|nr:MAG: Methylthioribose-1-phosphate isomerase [Candidatus Kapabacteria bacterium]ROL58276.1 MAG: S-methyl-5-thioribose-1-phosphate isomerase [Bacteroidetes/Chlorobi group bacterium Naka2016]
MKINGKHYQTIWETDEKLTSISIIDQRLLPHKFEIVNLLTFEDFLIAIKDMLVRGAPLIGVTTAYALYFAVKDCAESEFDATFEVSIKKLLSTRPTAVNLKNTIELARKSIGSLNSIEAKKEALLNFARKLLKEDKEICKKIGEHGSKLLEDIFRRKGATVNILTHCNAGWLATIDYGTALAPIYIARDKGVDVHVWVDETRPRLQGAKLTAFELLHEGIPHTVISDNTGGLLMQKGMVDIVIVGTDRTTRKGDVVNKIGTYLKALSAYDNNVPFYVALPSTSIDWSEELTVDQIPIEIRNENEVKYVSGVVDGKFVDVLITPKSSKALNYAFDITPSRLVTGLITERGICPASEEGLLSLFPEMVK